MKRESKEKREIEGKRGTDEEKGEFYNYRLFTAFPIILALIHDTPVKPAILLLSRQ